jgi:hypothetical protein
MGNNSATRRYFCCSIVGLAVAVIGLRLPFEVEQKSKLTTNDRDFLIVNGWVLTREDFAAGEVSSDVI